MEKVYINKRTGELYLWTNKTESGDKPINFWFWLTGENNYLIENDDELELLGEL